MEFKDYYKRIQDNRQSIIDYYVNQFGPETRQMFEKRFDRIKFCFYVNPNCIDAYIRAESFRKYRRETVNFVKNTLRNREGNTDTSDIYLKGRQIECNDKTKAVLMNFFGPTMSLGEFYGEPVFYDGIWAFLEDVSGTTATRDLQWEKV